MKRLISIILWLMAGTLHAQDEDTQAVIGNSLDIDSAINSVAGENELTVLASTLPPELLDQAVLSRLMEEITRAPEQVEARFNIDSHQLQDMFVVLSNAHSFINNNEMAAVRAMCRAYGNAQGSETERVHQGLDAYKRRAQFTRDFIARYYRVVVADVEANLPPHAVPAFNNYMDDRRARMANAGLVTASAVVENISSGRETIDFHCRRGTL